MQNIWWYGCIYVCVCVCVLRLLCSPKAKSPNKIRNFGTQLPIFSVFLLIDIIILGILSRNITHTFSNAGKTIPEKIWIFLLLCLLFIGSNDYGQYQWQPFRWSLAQWEIHIIRTKRVWHRSRNFISTNRKQNGLVRRYKIRLVENNAHWFP